MRADTYWRLSLLTPIVVPVVVVLLVLALGLPPAGFGEFAFYLLAGSVIVGGVPYLLTATYYLLRLRGMPPETYERASVFAPIVFTVLLSVFVTALAAFYRANQPFGLYAAYAVLPSMILGYSYVTAVHLCYRALVRWGVITSSAT